jgi:hypothetical protein
MVNLCVKAWWIFFCIYIYMYLVCNCILSSSTPNKPFV